MNRASEALLLLYLKSLSPIQGQSRAVPLYHTEIFTHVLESMVCCDSNICARDFASSHQKGPKLVAYTLKIPSRPAEQ